MKKEFLTISDGTFVLSETENENQFLFYRNDVEVLSDIDGEPVKLYHAYVMRKMINGEITEIVMKNIFSEISDDGKCMRLTMRDFGEKTRVTVSQKQPNLLKRLFHKFFR